MAEKDRRASKSRPVPVRVLRLVLGFEGLWGWKRLPRGPLEPHTLRTGSGDGENSTSDPVHTRRGELGCSPTRFGAGVRPDVGTSCLVYVRTDTGRGG